MPGVDACRPVERRYGQGGCLRSIGSDGQVHTLVHVSSNIILYT